jgi:flagellin-like protein
MLLKLLKLFRLRNRSVSPLIASILLIVVAVILVTVLLTWGKGFLTDSTDNVDDLLSRYKEFDNSFFLNHEQSNNGRSIFRYSPPNTYSHTDVNIIGYGVVGYTEHIVPLEPPVLLERHIALVIKHGVLLREFDLLLYLDNGYVITKNGITQQLKSPSTLDCPAGYIPVPGNHLYGTMNSQGGFCVMQYEAKMDQNSDGVGDINSTCKHTSYTVWDYSKSTEGCRVGDIVSSAEGYPITVISQAESISACESIGSGYHLITNNEWMTIVRNIELVKDNWSSGEIGVGSLKIGNNGSTVSGVSYNGVDPEYTPKTESDVTAKLFLSNNSEIWDLSGNVFEWVDKIIETSPTVPTRYLDNGTLVSDSTNRWYDYSSDGDSGYYIADYLNLSNWNPEYKDLFLLTSPYYNANVGVGRIYIRGDGTYTDRVFRRGGSWGIGADAGALSLNLSSSSSSTNINTGFRCVVVPE